MKDSTEIGANVIHQLIEARQEMQIQSAKLEQLDAWIEQAERTASGLKDLKKRIAAEKIARLPASLKAELDQARKASEETFEVSTFIPIKVVIERGGHDWVNLRIDEDVFADWELQDLPIPEKSLEEIYSFESILKDRLHDFSNIRYKIRKEYGVDAFDVLEDND